MSQRILVPIEGSARDAEALAMASHIARQLAAEILLIHVAPILFEMKEAIAAEQRLDRYAQTLRAEGIEAHFVMEYGEPSVEIAEAGDAHRAEMIILAPEHRTLLHRVLDPRVSAGLLSRSAVPLFILPDVTPAQSPAELLSEPDAAVIVALDGSANAEAALPVAIRLARAYARRLLLVRVVAPIFVLGSGVDAMKARHDAQYAEQAEAHRYLVATRQRLARGENVRVETLELMGPIADQLLHLPTLYPGSVLVMGTHGHGGLARVFLGSVASEMMSRTTTPLVVVPPRPASDAPHP